MTELEFLFEYDRINKVSPTIVLEENYGTSLINLLFIDIKAEIDISSFFLSYLKYYIDSNSLNKEDIKDLFSKLDISESTNLDYSKKLEKVSMERFSSVLQNLDGLALEIDSSERYVSYLDDMYMSFGILETEKIYYVFFRALD